VFINVQSADTVRSASKHQAAVWRYFTQCGPSLPPVTSADRYQMAVLAVGSAAMPQSFYSDFTLPVATDTDTRAREAAMPTAATEPEPADVVELSTRDISDQTAVTNTNDASDYFSAALVKLHELHNCHGSSAESSQAFLRWLNRIKSRGDWDSFLRSGLIPVRHRPGASIHVQPNAAERRRPGITRGCKRLHAGRPPVTADRSKRAKLMHARSQNIKQNKCNAKSYGRGH